LDFDEVTTVGEALRVIRAGECDGGVEGGVSSPSDDEGEPAQEEVSEKREGVREIGRLAEGGDDGSVLGKAVVLAWRFGSAAILRLRGLVVDFTNETTSEFFDWGFRGEPDMLAVTGDKTGGASDVLKLGAQAHLRLSRVLRPAPGVVTDILSKMIVNDGTSTLQLATDFSFLAYDVGLNWVIRVFRGEKSGSLGGGG
jgi:hypothetical protein